MTPSKIYKLSDIYCLTIRQPWAWLIVNGIKDVENRTWKTNRRGMFYIHAAKASSMKDYKLATQMLCEVYGDNHDVLMPPLKNMPHGGIVGSAEIVDCTKETDNPWHFAGQYAFVLRNPIVSLFQPMSGKLGFWNYEKGVVAETKKFYSDLGLQHLPANNNKLTSWPYDEPWQVSASPNSEPINEQGEKQ